MDFCLIRRSGRSFPTFRQRAALGIARTMLSGIFTKFSLMAEMVSPVLVFGLDESGFQIRNYGVAADSPDVVADLLSLSAVNKRLLQAAHDFLHILMKRIFRTVVVY